MGAKVIVKLVIFLIAVFLVAEFVLSYLHDSAYMHELIHSRAFASGGMKSTITTTWDGSGITTPDANQTFLCNESCMQNVNAINMENDIFSYNTYPFQTTMVILTASIMLILFKIELDLAMERS